MIFMNSLDQKTVLVVNDSPDQREMIQVIFQQAGYGVSTASSGREGFKIAKSAKFDLVISDVMMPDGDGIELCQWIRSDEKLRSLPILLVSGLRKDVSDVIEGLEVGADDYIELPVDPQQIIVRTERLIERKRMENLLKESECYFRTLIENISDIVSILSKDGTILYEGPAIEPILGYKPDELIGTNAFELIHQDDREQVISDFKKIIETRGKGSGRLLPAEYRYQTKKGSWRILESIGKVIDDTARGTVIIVNSRNVTEQRKAEKARFESEDKFGMVLKNSRDAIYQLNLKTQTFEYINPAAEEISGYSIEELIEGGFKFVNSLVHPEDWKFFREYIDRIQNSPETDNTDYSIEYRFKTKQKGYRWLRENRTVIRDDKQNSTAVIATSRDITEHKESREALHFQKTFLEAQIEASIDGVLVVTPTGEIISYNQRFVEMWGISEETLATKSHEKLLQSVSDKLADPQKVFKTISYVYQNPHIKHQVEITLKDGRVFERHSAPVIDADNKSFGRIWSFRDITKRKLTEEAHRESRQQYESLVNSIDGIVWEIEIPTLSFTFVSKQAERLLGYPVEEWTGEPDFWINHMHPDDRGWAVDFCLAATKKLENYEFDYRMIAADGRVVWLRDYVAVDSKDGVAVGLRGVMIDITERKQAERIIKENEERYRLVAETASDVIVTIDESNTILFINPAAEKVLGYKPEELTGNNLEIIIPERLRAAHNAGMRRYMQTGERRLDWNSVEISAIRGDGREIQIEISFGEYHENDKRLFTAVIRDITERKLAETALRTSQERYRFLAEAVPQHVWSATPAGLIDYANQRTFDYFGFDAKQGIIDEWHLSIHPDDLPVCAENWKRALKTGEPYQAEIRLKAADGEYQWHLGRATAMRDSNNEIIKWIGTNTNIDELKKAEGAVFEANKRAIGEYERLLDRIAKLSESLGSARDLQTVYRALYSFAVASVPCTGFFISLYDAKRDVRIPACAYTDGDEIDVSTLPAMAMADSPNSRAVSTGTLIIEDDFQAAMAGKPVINIGLDKNPNLPQSCLVAPMFVMGRIVGAVEVQSTKSAAFKPEHATALQMAANLAANAIENVRLLEQEQRSAEQFRLSQRLESVGRLAGGIAHDFNNMLTAINGYSELTLRRLDADDPLRRNIEEIKKAGQRSATLTHQLLAFSRKQVLQSKVIDLNEIIIDVTKMLQRLIGEDVHLQTILDPKLGNVSGDAGQLTQVIMNLAVNARDAMPKGGNLIIKTSNAYLDEEFAARFVPTQPGSYVLLAVTDTGVGMKSKEQEHIFEPFYTTKEIGKGTGLGLATVYGIVKQSGGYIWVDSEVGVGTTFNIYLPCIDAEVKLENENDISESVPKGRETVLLVEDEDMVRTLTRQMLEECGYRVIEAGSGVEALSTIEKQDCEIDLVMTDVVMPQMGGRELSEKLAAKCPQMRVLFTSGYTDDEIIRHDVIKEEINFIQKPFTFEALAHKVRESLDS